MFASWNVPMMIKFSDFVKLCYLSMCGNQQIYQFQTSSSYETGWVQIYELSRLKIYLLFYDFPLFIFKVSWERLRRESVLRRKNSNRRLLLRTIIWCEFMALAFQ